MTPPAAAQDINLQDGTHCLPAQARASHQPPERIRFGRQGWQVISYYRPRNAAAAPVVINLRGSRWSDRWATLEGIARQRLLDAGYALAIIPDGPGRAPFDSLVPNYLSALHYLRDHSADLGLDPDRVVLAGFYTGGHFATLLGTDERLLPQAGFAFNALRGVISIEGTGFDLPQRMREGAYERSNYADAIGDDANLWRNLSPAAHVGGPNAPRFLFLAKETMHRSQGQSQAMVDALLEAGADARLATFPEISRCRAGTYFMATPGGSGQEIMPFLAAAFAPAQP